MHNCTCGGIFDPALELHSCMCSCEQHEANAQPPQRPVSCELAGAQVHAQSHMHAPHHPSSDRALGSAPAWRSTVASRTMQSVRKVRRCRGVRPSLSLADTAARQSGRATKGGTGSRFLLINCNVTRTDQAEGVGQWLWVGRSRGARPQNGCQALAGSANTHRKNAGRCTTRCHPTLQRLTPVAMRNSCKTAASSSLHSRGSVAWLTLVG